MKKLLAILVVFLLCSVSYAKDLKIGSVDMFKVFQDYNKTKDYDETLKKNTQAKEKELDAKEEEIIKMKNKLDELKDQAKQKEQEKLSQASQEYTQLRREIFRDLKKEQDRKTIEIVDDINQAIKEYGTKNNFDLILHENAVLYGPNVTEITAEILKKINEKYAAKK